MHTCYQTIAEYLESPWAPGNLGCIRSIWWQCGQCGDIAHCRGDSRQDPSSEDGSSSCLSSLFTFSAIPQKSLDFLHLALNLAMNHLIPSFKRGWILIHTGGGQRCRKSGGHLLDIALDKSLPLSRTPRL